MRKVKYKRPKLTPYQLGNIFHEARYCVIEASTKSGKTHGCIVWLGEQAITGGGGNRNYWWIAPVYPQAEIAYRRMRDSIVVSYRKANESKLSIRLPNGATIWFKSGEKPDNLYGEDVYAAVIDEASRLREEAWHAIRSTLTKTQGRVRIIGNVKGRKNWAYLLARKAEAGEPDMHYSKIIAADAVAAGILSAKEIEDARRQLPEQVFRELFLAEPSDDGDNPFGLQHIASCVAELSSETATCYGVDLAKSVDWTVIIGLDPNGAICFFDRFQKPWTETKARIREVCGSTPTLVDSSGVGDPVLEDLQRGGSMGLSESRPNFEGYKFSSQSKQQLMEGLAVAVQQGRTTILEGPHRLEMESFEYVYSRNHVAYSAPEGMHDDCVCAHALAVMLYRSAKGRQPASSWGGHLERQPEWA